MPTTCGFPNCKFRSRYRGCEDNRHFYRVPKKPSVLRKRWLEAIGRTEETIVSQLRVCSGHFYGGEKREGDIPVSDPEIDAPCRIELPPKANRSSSNASKLKNNGNLPGKRFKTNMPTSLSDMSKFCNSNRPQSDRYFTSMFENFNLPNPSGNQIKESSLSLGNFVGKEENSNSNSHQPAINPVLLSNLLNQNDLIKNILSRSNNHMNTPSANATPTPWSQMIHSFIQKKTSQPSVPMNNLYSEIHPTNEDSSVLLNEIEKKNGKQDALNDLIIIGKGSHLINFLDDEIRETYSIKFYQSVANFVRIEDSLKKFSVIITWFMTEEELIDFENILLSSTFHCFPKCLRILQICSPRTLHLTLSNINEKFSIRTFNLPYESSMILSSILNQILNVKHLLKIDEVQIKQRNILPRSFMIFGDCPLGNELGKLLSNQNFISLSGDRFVETENFVFINAQVNFENDFTERLHSLHSNCFIYFDDMNCQNLLDLLIKLTRVPRSNLRIFVGISDDVDLPDRIKKIMENGCGNIQIFLVSKKITLNSLEELRHSLQDDLKHFSQSNCSDKMEKQGQVKGLLESPMKNSFSVDSICSNNDSIPQVISNQTLKNNLSRIMDHFLGQNSTNRKNNISNDGVNLSSVYQQMSFLQDNLNFSTSCGPKEFFETTAKSLQFKNDVSYENFPKII